MTNAIDLNDKALEARARRAARRVGLIARKTRWLRIGGASNTRTIITAFMLIDPARNNTIVAGEKLDMTADDVITFCANY
jgi:hypothetical protein